MRDIPPPTEATPRPWFVHDFSHPILWDKDLPPAHSVTISCDDPATITVARMGGGLYGDALGLEQAKFDAAFIVEAVNNYDKFRALLNDAADTINWLNSYISNKSCDDLVDEIREALNGNNA